MAISREQFADAYSKATLAAGGRRAADALITAEYEVLLIVAKSLSAPNVVPVFKSVRCIRKLANRIGLADGKPDWDFDLNRDGHLKPTRGYFKNGKRVQLAP